ncbi:MAG: hypothetical protein HKP56_19020 [Anderseniella sp.]|nr:hypothetical protein [Anderseniella sp.]
MKPVHQLATVSLKSQMDMGNFVIRRAYKQFVTGEVSISRLKTVDAKTIGNSFIEPFAFFQICDTQMYVIYQSASFELHLRDTIVF